MTTQTRSISSHVQTAVPRSPARRRHRVSEGTVNRDRLIRETKTLGLIEQNSHVLAAAIAMVSFSVADPEHDEKYGNNSADAQTKCLALLGMPDPERQAVTPAEAERAQQVIEAIQSLSFKIEAALIRAGLLPKREALLEPPRN